MTMMTFRKTYPERATVGEDGICRWSCEVDLKKDHHSRDLVMKVSLIVGGSVFLMMLLAMLSVGDFTFAWIPLVICGSLPLICLLCYELYRIAAHNKCLIAYELNGEGITMVRNPSMQKKMEGAALAIGLLGIAAGQPLQGAARGMGMYGTAQPLLTNFRKVRKYRGHPETCMIDLKTTFTMVQVWTNPDDYDMVLNFVRDHAENAVEIR